MRRADALTYARMPESRAKLARARDIVARAFCTDPSWHVAFSGGKDSTCVLHLVRGVAPETPATYSARQWDLPETTAFIAATPGVRLVTYEGYEAQPWAKKWKSREHAESHGVRWLEGKQAIMARGAPERGVFLGLRKDEAAYRRIHLNRNGTLFDCKKSDKYQCNPIADWSVLDVWGFIMTEGIQYNPAYDVMERIGIPLESQRIGPFEFALGAGALAIIKRGWPEFYNRYAVENPEARAYV